MDSKFISTYILIQISAKYKMKCYRYSLIFNNAIFSCKYVSMQNRFPADSLSKVSFIQLDMSDRIIKEN